MTNSQSINGKTALVTGASRGIGRAIAKSLGEAGAEVIINYANSKTSAEEVANEITNLGGKAYCLKADVSDESSVNELIKSALGRSEKIDILVNNAGITKDGLLMKMKSQDWDEVLNLNLKGAFLCTKAVSRKMLKQRSGRIINISSVVGLIGNFGQANYSASKSGLLGLTKSSAKEFASRGITVNAVAPEFISTDMTKDLEKENIISNIPLGLLGEPEHIAGTVRFLALDPAAAYITGQTINVDGGMVMS